MGEPSTNSKRWIGRRRSRTLVIKNPFYILASSPLADEQNRVLKHGETFAVFDRYGDIKPVGLGEEGLYHQGTRHLSCLVLKLGRERPFLLSSMVQEDNAMLAVDLTNPDIGSGERVLVPRGTLHLLRSKFLWQGICYESLRIRNYGLSPMGAELTIHFEADFCDIFEVRGTKRARRGRRLADAVETNAVVLVYEGLDDVVRRTRIEFVPPPTSLSGADARFSLALEPQDEFTILISYACHTGHAPAVPLAHDHAYALAEGRRQINRDSRCTVATSNEQFNDWLNRSGADLEMMLTDTAAGPYPYAGVPWFSTEFGRDGILTALECLWLNPSLAKGVLSFLAATQARETAPFQDAEPGKILHEARRGEMAALGEVPFQRYYGSVDATPLFVLLAGEYYERTGDRPFIESLWPNLERALGWMDTHGDPDGDGFVEYDRRSPKGLVHQGWKDSGDSVFLAEGTLAEAPIALCEVQGYVYAAKRRAAELAALLGLENRAEQLRHDARLLRVRFEQAFWCPEIGTYVLALDGRKQPCRVRTSNAGQCLFTGICNPQHARQVAETLFTPTMYSGWGVRTLDSSEVRYNPMSYHNGSVWPHDNALIGLGLARFGLQEAALKILTGLFDASLFVDLHRMPELFCGFPRRAGQGPTLYPVACAPQSWAAASVYLLLQACLGLEVTALEQRVCFRHPLLPEFLKQVHIRNLQVGDASVELLLHRHRDDVAIDVLRRTGNIEVVTVN